MEQAESAARYRTLVEQLPAITYLDEIDPTNPAGFNSLYLSPQFEAWLGYSIAEYQQRPTLWREIVHPKDRERVLADGAFLVTATDEYRLVGRDGRVLFCLTSPGESRPSRACGAKRLEPSRCCGWPAA
jgi:PAS domain S-box-containing protein